MSSQIKLTSFPFVMSQILKPTMEEILGIPLVVRNAAIGGIPSFPYGFCLEHFLGNDPDVIGWDYSMNEGSRDSSSLEAFVRQSLQQLPKHPMIIILDRNEKRVQLLRDYAKNNWLQDALAISRKDVVDEKVAFKQNPLPAGFQEWDEFGSPKSCPGRSKWHPKKQEHAMVGWLMAMHFTQALKIAYEKLSSSGVNDNGDAAVVVSTQEIHYPYVSKLNSVPKNDQVVTELLYGHEIHTTTTSSAADGTSSESSYYKIKDLSCRTSFLPATNIFKTIPPVVISGMVDNDDNDGDKNAANSHLKDIMTDRTDENDEHCPDCSTALAASVSWLRIIPTCTRHPSENSCCMPQCHEASTILPWPNCRMKF